ncbi:MAG: nitroreductase family protein [Acidimicrobiia bacterium]
MEFQEVLARRRMVRNYLAKAVDDEALERIIAAARKAPSAGFSQGQSMLVVRSESTRRAIAQLAGEDEYVADGFDPWISAAPVHVVVCISEQAYHDRYREPDKLDSESREIEWPIPYWWVDSGATMMLLLLAAVDEGLAAGFLGVHSVPGLRELLSIPEAVTPIGVVTIGHPAPDRRSGSLQRGWKSAAAVVHREKWQP